MRALLRRTRLDGQQSPSLLQTGRLSLDVGRREVREDGRLIDLTPTEFNILQTLMESSGYVFTRGELIEKALGYAYDGIDRTLDSHVRNLRRKIEPDPKNPTYIQTVYGVGYKMTEK
ncbi:MAG: winged helix-turn-helix domain-containing protein [Anaerolineae bacterium]